MILPSKKVLSTFIVVAALVAAIIIAFGRDKSSEAINFASNLVAGEKISIPENPSWQNELSEIAPTNIESTETENGDLSGETTTDIVSRTLISNYLALKQTGLLDQESAQKLIDQTVDYIEKTGIQDTDITQLQLNVVADNGKVSITEYGENLGNILKNKKPAEIQEESRILAQAAQSENGPNMDELDGIIVVYEKMLQELIKMPVPKTFIKAHLDITNGTRSMALAFTEMKNVSSDPFRALMALQSYQRGLTIGSQALQATISFIAKNGIVYKQGGGGYYLLYGL